MTEAEAREELTRWREYHGQRDSLIRQAHAAGVNKSEIHRLTGIARTTIDFILKGGTVEKYNDPGMREAIVKGLAQYILRGELHTKHPAHTDAQILARAQHDVLDMLQYGYTFPEGEAEQVAADAAELARKVQDTDPHWDQWAFGH